jgi:23S rRNA (cytidine2498-2'-O)-methyltransferase
MTVWAVDPGDLDPRIAVDPDVHHARTTAAEFFRSSEMRFDLAVNDMRMDPELSCRVMLDAASRLPAGALAIVTLKTGTHRPVETVQQCLKLLGRAYETVYARQLHHNRREVTVVARRRTSG